jgi:3-oxoacyl-[acyl-carrier protein] reductase
MGRVDILVCSAGITGPNTTTWEYPVADWKQVLDINLTGVFLCNRALVPQMQKNDYGRIVNIASIAGKEGNPNASAYSASKAGVISLTKSLGKELAKTGIRVNCVTPPP